MTGLIYLQKVSVAERIGALPSREREKTRKVWDLLNKIELNWFYYPLYAVTAAMFGLLLWLHPIGGEVATFGLELWVAGAVWSLIIYVSAYPLTKLVLYRWRCKRLLGELRNELTSEGGRQAFKCLEELDPSAIQSAARASRPGFFGWIW